MGDRRPKDVLYVPRKWKNSVLDKLISAPKSCFVFPKIFFHKFVYVGTLRSCLVAQRRSLHVVYDLVSLATPTCESICFLATATVRDRV